MRAAATTSPSATAALIAVEETPSTSSGTTTRKPSRSSVSRSPERRTPKRKSSPATTTSVPVARRYRSAKSSGRQRLERAVELRDEHGLDPRVLQQLEPAARGGQQLDLVPERDARVRGERDDRRREPRRVHGVEHRAVAAVDAVEAPDRDRARLGLELLGRARDLHQPSLASASSGGMILSRSASSTENGPISVRRSVRQWPPSASASDRTYVPDDTSMFKRAIGAA